MNYDFLPASVLALGGGVTADPFRILATLGLIGICGCLAWLIFRVDSRCRTRRIGLVWGFVAFLSGVLFLSTAHAEPKAFLKRAVADLRLQNVQLNDSCDVTQDETCVIIFFESVEVAVNRLDERSRGTPKNEAIENPVVKSKRPIARRLQLRLTEDSGMNPDDA